MNKISFTPKVTSPSATRVSERKRSIQTIERSFFKKAYKQKEKPSDNVLQTNHEKLSLGISQEDSQDRMYQLAACLVFRQIPHSKQAKAINNFRMKKLKRMLAPNKVSELLVSQGRLQSGNPIMLAGRLSKKQISLGKSLFAQNRQRDPTGKFAGEWSHYTKKNSSVGSTIDTREASLPDTLASTFQSTLLHNEYHDSSAKHFSELFSESGSIVDEKATNCFQFSIPEPLGTFFGNKSRQLTAAGGDVTYSIMFGTDSNSERNRSCSVDDMEEMCWLLEHPNAGNRVEGPFDELFGEANNLHKRQMDDEFCTIL
jgi:hypothetical protein